MTARLSRFTIVQSHKFSPSALNFKGLGQSVQETSLGVIIIGMRSSEKPATIDCRSSAFSGRSRRVKTVSLRQRPLACDLAPPLALAIILPNANVSPLRSSLHSEPPLDLREVTGAGDWFACDQLRHYWPQSKHYRINYGNALVSSTVR